MDRKRVGEEKKIRILCTRTGDKFDQWWEDNLKYMVDKYSKVEYDEFVCVRDDMSDDDYGTFNNLIMFDRYRDDGWINLAFDLDIVIKGDCNKFLKEDFHVCDSKQWQTEEYYTNHLQISSDIVSWSGDVSHIYSQVLDDLDYYYVKYHNGIDKYLFDEHNPKRYTEGYTSIQTMTDYGNYDVVIFNGHYETMKKNGWWAKYTLDKGHIT